MVQRSGSDLVKTIVQFTNRIFMKTISNDRGNSKIYIDTHI